MKLIFNLILLALPLSVMLAQQPDATAIMNRTRDLTLTGSMSASVSLIITEKNGSIRKRTISMTTKSFADGSEKRLIRFVEPADVKGTSMLIYDNKDKADEMWIYLPALKKTRRIVSSEKGKSFMSSEFTNADFTSPSPADFNNSHLEGSGNSKVWIIESRPVNDEKASEYGFSRKVSYVEEDTYVLKKMEFYNFENRLYKKIEVRAVEPGKNGSYLIKDMYAENILNGRNSEIKFNNIGMNQKIEDSVFTLQNLEK